jgi:hypothetical protein
LDNSILEAVLLSVKCNLNEEYGAYRKEGGQQFGEEGGSSNMMSND